MSNSNSRTITAFFDTRSEADAAVAELRNAGVDEANMSIRAGAEAGATTASSSSEHKGFFEALGDFFMPDDDRDVYAEGLRRGGYIVAVTSEGKNDDFIYDILESRGSVDLDERASTWRSEGWQSERPLTTASTGLLDNELEGTAILDDDASSVGTATASTGRPATDEEVIPVVEEQLRVGKRDVNLGRVRVRSYLREEPVSANVNLREERVTLERRAVDRPLTDADAAFRERTIEAEAHAEEAVVGKVARVIEEVSLRKDVSEREETITDTVRKQEVEIEDDRIEPSTTKATR